MNIYKIKKKYCTKNKVQVMFSNAPSQIILSKDGYIYLREQDIIIHRYLIDPVRKEMPYHNNPLDSIRATHLFEYDKLYAKFTKYREMNKFFRFENSYSLTFLYFVRAENGEALMAEIDFKDFKKEKETSQKFSKIELEKFLYEFDAKTQAKCLFELSGGIKYVKHINEKFSIPNDKFFNFLDEEFVSQKEPILLIINKDGRMCIYNFTITCINDDCFEVKSSKRFISLDFNEFLCHANNCKYTIDI